MRSTPVVRLNYIEIKGLGPVHYGLLGLDTARRLSEASILGVYGQNGTGKSTLVEALEIVHSAVRGAAVVPDDHVPFRLHKEKGQETPILLECGFILSERDGETEYDVTYTVALQPTRNSEKDVFVSDVRIVYETLKYSYKGKDGKMRRSLIMDTRAEHQAFLPNTKFNAFNRGSARTLKDFWQGLTAQQQFYVARFIYSKIRKILKSSESLSHDTNEPQIDNADIMNFFRQLIATVSQNGDGSCDDTLNAFPFLVEVLALCAEPEQLHKGLFESLRDQVAPHPQFRYAESVMHNEDKASWTDRLVALADYADTLEITSNDLHTLKVKLAESVGLDSTTLDDKGFMPFRHLPGLLDNIIKEADKQLIRDMFRNVASLDQDISDFIENKAPSYIQRVLTEGLNKSEIRFSDLLLRIRQKYHTAGKSFIFSEPVVTFAQNSEDHHLGYVLKSMRNFALYQWFIVKSAFVADATTERYMSVPFTYPFDDPKCAAVILIGPDDITFPFIGMNDNTVLQNELMAVLNEIIEAILPKRKFEIHSHVQLFLVLSDIIRQPVSLDDIEELNLPDDIRDLLLNNTPNDIKGLVTNKKFEIDGKTYELESEISLYSRIDDIDDSITPFVAESSGVKRLVSIAFLLISMYINPSMTVVIDEMDACVFEYLLGVLLKTLKLGGEGQLIFTSHNLHALEVLGNRCIAFTTKDPNNRYRSLKDVKKTNNLRDVYYRIVATADSDFSEPTNTAKLSRALNKLRHIKGHDDVSRNA